MKLNYKVTGSGKPLLILHGLMGSLDNWHTLADRFGQDYKVYTIDLRNHGRSPHSDEHSFGIMADDLFDFINEHTLTRVSLIGHSMGGKVAMQFALEHAELVENLIVADIAPRQYKRGHDDVFDALFAIDLSQLRSRKDAEDKMLPHLKDAGTRQFLLKNLERNSDGTYKWRMNLQALNDNYEEMIKAVTSTHVFQGNTLFIKGGNSNYITDEDLIEIKKLFPAYKLVTILDAGHWVHAQNPDEFYKAVTEFIQY